MAGQITLLRCKRGIVEMPQNSLENSCKGGIFNYHSVIVAPFAVGGMFWMSPLAL